MHEGSSNLETETRSNENWTAEIVINPTSIHTYNLPAFLATNDHRFDSGNINSIQVHHGFVPRWRNLISKNNGDHQNYTLVGQQEPLVGLGELCLVSFSHRQCTPQFGWSDRAPQSRCGRLPSHLRTRHKTQDIRGIVKPAGRDANRTLIPL